MFGFGAMGEAIARRLLSQQYQLNIWSRTSEKLIVLAESGAMVKSSVAEAIMSADTIICVLPDVVALQEVLFDVDWAHELQGRMVINFGSVNVFIPLYRHRINTRFSSPKKASMAREMISSCPTERSPSREKTAQRPSAITARK